MTRSIIGLLLGGILLLMVAACGSSGTPETIPEVSENPEADSAISSDTDADTKPVITVSLSPT